MSDMTDYVLSLLLFFRSIVGFLVFFPWGENGLVVCGRETRILRAACIARRMSIKENMFMSIYDPTVDERSDSQFTSFSR